MGTARRTAQADARRLTVRRSARGDSSISTLAFGIGTSPIGRILVAWSERGLRRVHLLGAKSAASARRALEISHPGALMTRDDVAARARIDAVLHAMLQRKARSGLLALDITGTRFQRAVWAAAIKIPAGTTTTYGALARRLGMRGAARAVGNALNANPVALLVPCHRVLHADGGLGGYAQGLAAKRRILAWESGVGAAIAPRERMRATTIRVGPTKKKARPRDAGPGPRRPRR